MKPLHHVALGTALTASVACVAVAGDVPATVLSKLATTGEVACQPALPFFCGNIHVACSGRTTIRTFAFKMRAGPSRGSIESGSDTAGVSELYQDGPVAWESANTSVILRPHAGSGYIKVLANGTYSFRLYAQGQGDGVMSYGRCD